MFQEKKWHCQLEIKYNHEIPFGVFWEDMDGPSTQKFLNGAGLCQEPRIPMYHPLTGRW